ncbi:MAG: hypothetical protein SVW51_05175 [Pseudomonadota bacterium]|nr:hypothetical protein [Pseudomonadota bacterium]
MSGTINLSVSSNWHPSGGEAEAECVDLINTAIEDVINELVDEGKEYAGSSQSSIDLEEDERGDGTYYKASTTGEVFWVYQETKKQNKNNKNIDKPVETTILEDEILKRVAKSDVTYDKSSINELYFLDNQIAISDLVEEVDDVYTTQNFVLINRLSSPIKKTFKIELSEDLGKTVSLTKTVKTKQSSKLNLKIKAVSAEASQSIEFSTVENTSMSFKSRQSFTDTFTLEIPARKKWIISVKKLVKKGRYNIEGTVTVDGKVKLEKKRHRCRGDWPFTRCGDEWSSKLVKLSDILKSNRTFDIQGVLTNTFWDIDYSVEYSEESLMDNEEQAVETNSSIPVDALFPNFDRGWITELENDDFMIEIDDDVINRAKRIENLTFINIK